MSQHTECSGIIQSAQRGEPSAQEEISRIVQGLARYICSGRTPGGAPELNWEDVAQEACRYFFSVGVRQYRGEGSERSYLYSIVKTTWLQLARGAARRRLREAKAVTDAEMTGAENLQARLDVDRTVLNLLERLDESCRELLKRMFLDGASYGELALELGLAQSSVRAKVSRCIRRARELGI
jgi:RNA polymerase sigma-70 factor (ECF subfamily)